MSQLTYKFREGYSEEQYHADLRTLDELWGSMFAPDDPHGERVDPAEMAAFEELSAEIEREILFFGCNCCGMSAGRMDSLGGCYCDRDACDRCSPPEPVSFVEQTRYQWLGL